MKVEEKNEYKVRIFFRLNYPCEIRKFMKKPGWIIYSDGERHRFVFEMKTSNFTVTFYLNLYFFSVIFISFDLIFRIFARSL